MQKDSKVGLLSVCGGARGRDLIHTFQCKNDDKHIEIVRGSLASSVFPSSNICEATSSPLKYKKFKFSIKKNSAFFAQSERENPGVLAAPP